ncbi:hypothetical protein DUNSADRAFT_13581 [Dunaliella salina]|uniref:Encoded protein n=1 Tax=Dunaliella salina TaxID=3046 RepID=A0ABQ7H360_DUNSA|nr:hypothetical protein DUNSADRAFT_13581 [Dunaliella salina]|eukprot:KAF5841308.1 hypothetical protein DUNSADRAFT_13581 [Dunaliella salina]
MRNSAGFVRHKGACVNNFLLPIKMVSITWAQTSPRVEECQQLYDYIQLARRLSFSWRVYLRMRKREKISNKKAAREQRARQPGLLQQTKGVTFAGAPASGDDDSSVGRTTVRQEREPTKNLLPHEELLCLANAHAKCLLSEHGLPLPESSKTRAANPFSLPHKTARSTVLVEVETCAMRMAFSHIPLWHALMQKLDVKLQGISVILCNDKQSSFGAPDVLQACVDNVALVYKIDSL